MYVYRKTEAMLWTVGYYAPDGAWQSESDHGNERDAAERVHYLNGGGYADGDKRIDELVALVGRLDRAMVANLTTLEQRIDSHIYADDAHTVS